MAHVTYVACPTGMGVSEQITEPESHPTACG